MTERPIIFSPVMVKAILSDRKYQTRRIMNPQPSENWKPYSFGAVHKMKDGEFVMKRGGPVTIGYGVSNEDGDEAYVSPYGSTCDQLWVRESWYSSPVTNELYGYVADGDHPHGKPYRVKPSIHMPRTHSRLTLTNCGVRAERLQALTEADAIGEGIYWHEHLKGYVTDDEGRNFNGGFAVRSFLSLWNSIHGYESWDSNPWVWVVTFERKNK